MDISDGIIRGRIPGRVAILWDKRLDSCINIIRLEVDWRIAVLKTKWQGICYLECVHAV